MPEAAGEPFDPLASQDDWLTVRPGEPPLFARQWGDAQGRHPLLIIHGAGEHSGHYAQTAADLVRGGYVVHAVDLPGHGRSPGVRGHILRFAEYLEVVAALIRHVEVPAGPRPVLLGHSLGGLIATSYAAAHPTTVRRLILSAPLWGLRVPVPAWKQAAARLLDVWWPSLTFARPRLIGRSLSHDPEVTARYASDPLVHARASVRWYTELQRQLAILPDLVPGVRVPLLVLQGEADRIADPQAVDRLFPLVGSSSKRVIRYAGYYHEVLNELGRERVIRDLLEWLSGLESHDAGKISSSERA